MPKVSQILNYLCIAVINVLCFVLAVFNLIQKVIVWFIVGILRVWHYMFSPWLGVRCRFEPTCSEYAVVALKRFGLLKGGILTIYRVIRCNPMCKGGRDPVPERLDSIK